MVCLLRKLIKFISDKDGAIFSWVHAGHLINEMLEGFIQIKDNILIERD